MKKMYSSQSLEPSREFAIESPLNSDNSLCNIYEKLSPIIPKVFMINIDDTSVSAVRENSMNDFSAKLSNFTLNGKYVSEVLPGYQLPSLYLCLNLTELEINTIHEQLLFIELYNIDLKLENDIVNVYIILKSFQLLYNHKEIYNWINKNFITRTTEKVLLLSKKKSKVANNRYKKDIETFFNNVVIKGCAELWNISTIFNLNGAMGSLNITHSKLLLEQYLESRSNVYKNYALNLFLSNRHWSTELMLESLWWCLNPDSKNLGYNNLKKTHIRGSCFFMGVSLMKLSSYSDSVKLDLSIHTLRTEYSALFSKFVLEMLKCVNDYKMLKSCMKKDTNLGVASKSDGNVKKYLFGNGIWVNLKTTDMTCFFINQYEMCKFINLSEFALTRSKIASTLTLSALQLSSVDFSKSYSINNLSDFATTYINIKLIRLECANEVGSRKIPHISISFIDETEFMWNSNIHMHFFTLATEMLEFRDKSREVLGKSETKVQESRSPKLQMSLEIFIENSVIFEIKISEKHSMEFLLANLYADLKEDSCYVSIENISVNIDDAHIFEIKDIDIKSMSELSVLVEERKHYERFLLPSNKVWATNIGVFKGIVPYDFDFYDATQNEFVTLYKWLKIVHNYKKKPFTVDTPLPADMIIQVREFLLEMSDDPFEVKLRDNYVLLLDEYFECIKRKEMLDEKIADYQAERLILPAGTVEHLNASLIAKNSEIYIQRSKQMNVEPPRTRLFAWILTDLKILALADPTIHGTENVTRMMQEIDSESPWPEEGLEFTTLWCRAINFSCTEWQFRLRDYPQPMFDVKNMSMFGYLCGAEQAPPRRAKRDVAVEIGAPFGTHMIQRGMTPLKFYHDFDWDLDYLCYAFGPCWEPVMAQCNLSFEKISAPSKDPSPPLPFWDKMRLLFHGKLTILAKQFTILLHASLDPYNTTEEMELTWHNCGIIWGNAKIVFKGDLNVSVRTASRYDDCRLLHLPNLKLSFKLNWICLANPNEHHIVIPCAPNRLPEYSSNQIHDSFRAFRSQNLNISSSFDIKQNPNDTPNLVLFGSTLRWFESLKLILSGVTRPTRRGTVFKNVRAKKQQLSRHYKKAHLQMSLHNFQVYYWMSHALHRGFQLNGGRVSFSSEHFLTLQQIDDGLTHRARADWAIIYMNCELNDAEIWLRTTTNADNKNDSSESISNLRDSCRDYFLSLSKVSYGREALIPGNEHRRRETPTHKLVVHDLKGAWTKNNRDVAFGLFDSFMKSQKLKDNLSTEALKSFRKETSGNNLTPLKTTKSPEPQLEISTSPPSGSSGHSAAGKSKSTPPDSMLQKLLQEADHKLIVFSDDLSTQTRERQLVGLQACQDNDITHYNWSISLVNSQVLLKGCETSGYVILSAAKSEIHQKVHRPVWRDRSIVSKTTWEGILEAMQYYATVSAEDNYGEMAEIMWLTVDNIQEKDREQVINEYPDLPHLVGSGQSVGGVVSETVGASTCSVDGEKHPTQLQRIVSRCKCEFFYVSYGDTIDPNTVGEVPAPPPEETISPWERENDEPVDAFTLMHHDLEVCTNSLQYAMILDIVNNLLLYVEPQRKQALEKLARMRFQLQLKSGEDQKRPIQQLQTQIRSLMSHQRILEKDIHLLTKAHLERGISEELRPEYEHLQKQIKECKDKLSTQSDMLDMMLSCYKETQLSASNRLATIRNDKPLTIVRTNEICFKHAQWRLTEADGQIGIADLMLSNFLYTKKSKNDDSVEHLLELGYIRINNLNTQDSYSEVLTPTEIQREMPVDHKRVLRVFCREKHPVGGISVKEHFEINVVPITIAISKKFYSTMLKFCFPDRDTSEGDVDDIDDASSVSGSTLSVKEKSKKKKKEKSSKDSNFYVKIEKDDVEKMKERAEKNKLFIYIKIPEVPVRVSYKGNKEKNLEDITDFHLLVPTLEYHNVTWTWLDLLMAMKSDSRKVLLSQVRFISFLVNISNLIILYGQD